MIPCHLEDLKDLGATDPQGFEEPAVKVGGRKLLLGFARFSGLGFRVWVGLRISDLGFRAQGTTVWC